MQSIKINLQETFSAQNGGGVSFDWVKRIESIDLKADNGFGVNGQFVSDFKEEAAQIPGLYLTHRKGRGWFRTFVIRLHEDGTLEQIAFTKDAKWFPAIKEEAQAALDALKVVAEAETVLVEGVAEIEITEAVSVPFNGTLRIANESLNQTLEIVDTHGHDEILIRAYQGETHLRNIVKPRADAQIQLEKWLNSGFVVVETQAHSLRD